MRCAAANGLPPTSPGSTSWSWREGSTQLPDAMSAGGTWPRISILAPSYEQGEFIEETLRSALLQGYPDLKYIIIDGGTTHGSVDIIQKHELRLSHPRLGGDSRQAIPIAEGFPHATGEVLAWLNWDDRYRHGVLERVAFFFTGHAKVSFGARDLNCIQAESRFVHRIYAIRPSRFLTANLGIHCCPQQRRFWRRSAYEQMGGIDNSLQHCMDRDLFIRLARSGPSRRIPGPPLADFRVHDQGKSSTILHIAKREGDAWPAKYGSPYVRPGSASRACCARFGAIPPTCAGG